MSCKTLMLLQIFYKLPAISKFKTKVDDMIDLTVTAVVSATTVSVLACLVSLNCKGMILMSRQLISCATSFYFETKI